MLGILRSKDVEAEATESGDYRCLSLGCNFRSLLASDLSNAGAVLGFVGFGLFAAKGSACGCV